MGIYTYHEFLLEMAISDEEIAKTVTMLSDITKEKENNL